MKTVAELCTNVFDGPFEWFDLVRKSKAVQNYLKELMNRKVNFVDRGQEHFMVVAYCNANLAGS